MTEPSDRAIGLAVTATPLMPVGEFARLIDDALAEARQEGWDSHEDAEATCCVENEQEVKRLTAERDELRATVERVQDLCNEWASDALGELVDVDDYGQGAQDMLHECYGLVSRALRGKCSTCRMPNPCRKHELRGEQ